MKKYVLQALLVVCSFLIIQGCSDDDNAIDLKEVNSAAAAMPAKIFFAKDVTKAAAVQLSVAVDAKSPEAIGFEVKVADNSEVSADKVTFSREHFTIEKGKRSFEFNCTIEADAVEAGSTKLLKIDFMSQNAKVSHLKLEIPVEVEKVKEPEPEPEPEPENTIIYIADFKGTVDMDKENWLAVMLNGEQVAGFFQTSVAVGTAPTAKRIHFDNYGQDIIGVAAGDLINVTPLEEGAVIGEGATWVSNPEWANDANYVYMPVLYSGAYKEWEGKTAYIGAKISLSGKVSGKICNAWIKVTVSEGGECEVDGIAYDAWGHDIKAGQTVSEKK